MIRNTRIDWSNFTKLRNEDSHCIEAAMCNSCKIIIHSYSDKRFQNHRYSNIFINSLGYIMRKIKYNEFHKGYFYHNRWNCLVGNSKRTMLDVKMLNAMIFTPPPTLLPLYYYGDKIENTLNRYILFLMS